MTEQFKEWFVAERAKALAVVLFTRRSDLVIQETKEDTGLDYTVSILNDETSGKRSFGVLIRATMSPVTIEQANAQLKPTMKEMKELGPFGFPICVFFFTAKDDQGYYTWGHEPLIGEGQAKLQVRTKASCRPLDDSALEEIVSLVNKWYDAFFAAVML